MSYRIIPSVNPLLLDEQDRVKCILGVSLNNKSIYDKHFEMIFRWVSQNFGNCKFVIGDYINRITEMIFNDKDEEQAIADSLLIGDEVYNCMTRAIPPEFKNKFDIIRWKDLFDFYPEINEEINNIKYLYDHDDSVNRELTQTATQFIQKSLSKDNSLSLSLNQAIEKSKEYLFEEMAVFSVLIKHGYRVQLYPGTQLKILKSFANGTLKEFNTSLTKGIYIDLNIKKR